MGDKVFFKVSSWKGIRRFGLKGKLGPRYIGPFEILDRVGEVSYRLALPPQLSHVHNVFHVSQLRGYNYHPLHVIQYPFADIRPDPSYVEEPEAIIDREERVIVEALFLSLKFNGRTIPIARPLGNSRKPCGPSTLICSLFGAFQIHISFNFEDEIFFSR